MNRFIKILGIVFVTVILQSCNKNLNSVDKDDISIELEQSYILFDSGITTRGDLVTEQYLESDFAVLGYQYPGSWGAAKAMAEPNVFYENDNSPAIPRVVEYNGSTYEYKPLEAWTGNNYSFFAYYPAENTHVKLFDNGVTKQGAPYITYSIPVATDKETSSDPSELIDLMTASFTDTSIDSNPEVSMEMKHRLSAVDIRARNYYQKEIDDEVKLITVEITKLELRPNIYTKAIIKLDTDHLEENELPIVASESKSVLYTLIDSEANLNNTDWVIKGLDIRPNGSKDTAPREITINNGENATSLLFIPQDSKLSGSLVLSYNLKYKVNDSDQDFTIYKEGLKYVKNLEDFDRNLIAGRRYYIEITFTSDAVTIDITSADEWEEKDDVKLEFE